MIAALELAAVVSALLAALCGVVLIAIKVTHHIRSRRRALRRARYTEVLGTLLAGDDEIPRIADVEDRVLTEVLIEYLQLVSGESRQRLIGFANDLQLRSIYARILSRSRLAPRRMEAATVLAELAHSSIVGVLMRALNDPMPEVRIQAARGIAKLGHKPSMPRVVALLDDDEPWVIARIADQLTKAGPPAVPALIDAVENPPSVSIQQSAARVLGLIGDPRAEKSLLALLDSDDADLRLVGVTALEGAGTVDSMPAIVARLGDDDWRVRARAATAVGAYPLPGSAEALHEALTDSNWWVRQNAAKSLARMPDGIAQLRKVVDGPDAYARDAALLHLGMMGALENST